MKQEEEILLSMLSRDDIKAWKWIVVCVIVFWVVVFALVAFLSAVYHAVTSLF